MSSFVLERRYALQLPGSYVDVDAVEMEYIDGGAISIWKAAWWIDFAVDVLAVVSVITGTVSAYAVLKSNRARGLLIQSVSRDTKALKISISTGAITTLIPFALKYAANTTIGMAIARAWDSVDRYPNDNELDALW